MTDSGGERLNPYQASLEEQPASIQPIVFRRSRFAAYLTRIVVWNGGVNILGLLECFSFFGLGAGGLGVMTQFVPYGRGGPIALASMALVPLAVAGFDLWWRSGQPEKNAWARFFSPYAGGCLLYVPVWLALVAGLAAISILIIININR